MEAARKDNVIQINTSVIPSNKELVAQTFRTFEEQIAEFKEKNNGVVFDLSLMKNRKALRSHVYTMRQAKKPISEAKAKAKKEALEYGRMLDAKEKELILEIDTMISEAIEPLEAIEKREAEEAEAIRLKEEKIKAEEEAYQLHDIFIREKELAEKEAEIKRQEEERQEKERLEQIKKEVAETARKEAEEKARKDLEASERAKIEAEIALKQEKERAKQAEIEAESRAKQAKIDAENKRLFDIKAAEEKAEQEKQAHIDRIKKAQAEKDQREKERLDAERAEQARIDAEDEARKANLEHRRKVNKGIIKGLVACGISEESAKLLIISIVKNEIPNLRINY